jgi:hypothetical protein
VTLLLLLHGPLLQLPCLLPACSASLLQQLVVLLPPVHHHCHHPQQQQQKAFCCEAWREQGLKHPQRAQEA